MRDDRQRLLDILDAIERINRYTAGGRAVFEGNELVQAWVLRHLQLIGEAARRLSEEFRTRYPDIPWAPIVALRNYLVHDYFTVNLDIVWAVDRDLSVLRSQVEAALREQGWNRPPSVFESAAPYRGEPGHHSKRCRDPRLSLGATDAEKEAGAHYAG